MYDSKSWRTKSNHTPFSDLCELVSIETVTDADGYKTPHETVREVFCSVSGGVTRTEFYEAYKAGVQLAMAVELWEDDYSGERLLNHAEKRYGVVRTYPTGRGTLELTCSEVKR